MGGIIVLVCSILLLGFLFFQPKLGAILVWPILLAYPHHYWEQLGLMPMNIGFDDLFICVFFLMVFIRRNMIDGLPVRLGYVFWCSAFLLLFILTSHINGYFKMGASFREFAKTILKGVIDVLLVYSLVNTIDNVKDLGRTAFAFCFFVGISGILIILQQYFPAPMSIFTQTPETTMALAELVRPTGAFVNANSGALVMDTAYLIIVCTLGLKSRFFTKSMRFAALCILLLAIFFTRSRSGFMCLVIPLMLMAVLGKNKRYAWAVIVLAIVGIAVSPAIISRLFERFQAGGGIIEGIKVHSADSLEAWRHVTWDRLLFGQPPSVDMYLWNLAPHGFYLGTPLRYGFGGVLVVVILFTVMLRKSRAMKVSLESTIRSLGSAVRWGVLAYLLYGLVGTPFGNIHVRYTLFLLAVLADRGFAIMNQDEQLYQVATELGDNNLATADDYNLVDYNDVGTDPSYEENMS
jgi:hypothetical protein